MAAHRIAEVAMAALSRAAIVERRCGWADQLPDVAIRRLAAGSLDRVAVASVSQGVRSVDEDRAVAQRRPCLAVRR